MWLKKAKSSTFKVAEGDVLLGLASSGIHSNGYSLVRRVFADYTGEEVLPELEGKKLKDVLLEPTRIYVKAALPLIKEELVNGIAHINRWWIHRKCPTDVLR